MAVTASIYDPSGTNTTIHWRGRTTPPTTISPACRRT